MTDSVFILLSPSLPSPPFLPLPSFPSLPLPSLPPHQTASSFLPLSFSHLSPLFLLLPPPPPPSPSPQVGVGLTQVVKGHTGPPSQRRLLDISVEQMRADVIDRSWDAQGSVTIGNITILDHITLGDLPVCKSVSLPFMCLFYTSSLYAVHFSSSSSCSLLPYIFLLPPSSLLPPPSLRLHWSSNLSPADQRTK